MKWEIEATSSALQTCIPRLPLRAFQAQWTLESGPALYTPPSVLCRCLGSRHASLSSPPLVSLFSSPSSGVSSLMPSSVQHLTSLGRTTAPSKLCRASTRTATQAERWNTLMSSARWGRLCAKDEAEAGAQKEKWADATWSILATSAPWFSPLVWFLTVTTVSLSTTEAGKLLFCLKTSKQQCWLCLRLGLH